MKRILGVFLIILFVICPQGYVFADSQTITLIKTDFESGLESGVMPDESLPKGTNIVRGVDDSPEASKFHRFYVSVNDTQYGDVSLVNYPDTDNTAVRIYANDESTTDTRSNVVLLLNNASALASDRRLFNYQMKFNASEIADGCYSRMKFITKSDTAKGTQMDISIYNNKIGVDISTPSSERHYEETCYDDVNGWQELTLSWISGGGKADGMALFVNGVELAVYTPHSQSVYFDGIGITQSGDNFKNSTLYIDDIEFGYGDISRPKVSNVLLDGIPEVGQTLTANYNSSSDTIITWKYSREENGTYQKIPDASGSEYTVSAKYAECFIKAYITPASGMFYGLTEITDPILIDPVYYDFECRASVLNNGRDISESGIETGNNTIKVVLNNENGYIDCFPVTLMANVYYKNRPVSFWESEPLIEIQPGENEIMLSFEIYLNESESIDDYSVRFFMLNNITDLKPRAGSYEFDADGIKTIEDSGELCTVENASVSLNNYRRNITISGNILSDNEKSELSGRRISLLVTSENETHKYYDQTNTLSDGTFEFNYGLPSDAEAGVYSVVLSTVNADIYECKFNVDVTPEFLSDILTKVNSATVETLGEIFAEEEYSVLFERENNIYQRLTDSREKVCKDVLTGNYTELGDFIDIFTQKALVGAFCDAGNKEAIRYLIEEFNDILNLNTDEGSSISNLSPESLNELYDLWSEDELYEDIDAIRLKLRTDIMLESIENSKWGSIRNILNEFEDILTLDEEDLISVDKIKDPSDVYKAIAKKSYDTPAEVKKAFSDAVEDALNDESGKKRPSSGTGGSKGGSGVSFKTETSVSNKTPVVLPIPENNNEPEFVFTDITSDNWASGSIYALASRKIINGFDDGTFRPDNPVTRAEFVKMLVLCLNIKTDSHCSFIDVSENDWYAPYIAAAQELGIAIGDENGNFKPNDYITRQDIATLSYRAAKQSGIIFEDKYSSEFDDANDISSYALESVCELKKSGIINGMTETLFMPTENATRAQAAKIIYGIADAAEKNLISED